VLASSARKKIGWPSGSIPRADALIPWAKTLLVTLEPWAPPLVPTLWISGAAAHSWWVTRSSVSKISPTTPWPV
jgi:hypothetical protein